MGLSTGEVVGKGDGSRGISCCAWGLSVCPTNMANPVLLRQCPIREEDLLVFRCWPYPSLPSRPLQVATPRTSVPRALASGKAPGRSSTRSEGPGARLSARSGLVQTSPCCPPLPAPAASILTAVSNHPLLRSTSPFLPALTQRTPKLWVSQHHPHRVLLARVLAGRQLAPTRSEAPAPATFCSALPIPPGCVLSRAVSPSKQ